MQMNVNKQHILHVNMTYRAFHLFLLNLLHDTLHVLEIIGSVLQNMYVHMTYYAHCKYYICIYYTVILCIPCVYNIG